MPSRSERLVCTCHRRDRDNFYVLPSQHKVPPNIDLIACLVSLFFHDIMYERDQDYII